MKGETVKLEHSEYVLKKKAHKALKKAKIIEQEQLKEGKTYIRIDSKTWVLK